MGKTYWVYMMTNKWNTVLYTGMSGTIEQRTDEHYEKNVSSFTKRYNVNKIVYLAECLTPTEAAEQERRVKRWTRKKKIVLIESINPQWKDLFRSGDPSLRSGMRTS